MIIPEVILYNTITNFQLLTASDYFEKAEKSETFLYQMFKKDDNGNDIIMGDYDYFKQSVSILTRDIEKQRHLKINIGYNMQRVSVPTIHILMPNDNRGRIDSIGHSEEKEYDEIAEILTTTKQRSNSSTYYLMITSDNSSEVMIIYYWLKSMFLLFHEELELLGLQNLNHSGQDINLQADLAPPNIFHRNLSLSFDYLSSSTIKMNMEKIKDINFSRCVDMDKYFKDHMKSINP